MVYKWFISKKTIIVQGSRGGPTFSRGGGSNFCWRGVQMLISIETHRTDDFSVWFRSRYPHPSVHACIPLMLTLELSRINLSRINQYLR